MLKQTAENLRPVLPGILSYSPGRILRPVRDTRPRASCGSTNGHTAAFSKPCAQYIFRGISAAVRASVRACVMGFNHGTPEANLWGQESARHAVSVQGPRQGWPVQIPWWHVDRTSNARRPRRHRRRATPALGNGTGQDGGIKYWRNNRTPPLN
jgi:hypothetical protein